MIPLSVPDLAGNEWQYVKDCLDTGWISSAGSYVNRFEAGVADYVGSKHGIAAVNGTAALHIALKLLDVGPGDAVLVSNLTFVATLNAIRYTGATPILVDARADTWQMDPDLVEGFLEGLQRDNRTGKPSWKGLRVAALLPVHVLGNLCDMERLQAIAGRYSLALLEDSTEALGSRSGQRHAGTFGTLGTFSFNGNKILSTGGGGVIVTNDPLLAARAKHLTTTAKAQRDEYFHDEVGYNYRLVNVLAAIGVAQMEQLPDILARKRVIDARYRQELASVGDIRFQDVAPGITPNCWLHTFATGRKRELLAHLKQAGIEARPFWVPMNRLPMFTGEHYLQQRDVAGGLYDRCVSIPSSSNLTADDQSQVIEAIRRHFQ